MAVIFRKKFDWYKGSQIGFQELKDISDFASKLISGLPYPNHPNLGDAINAIVRNIFASSVPDAQVIIRPLTLICRSTKGLSADLFEVSLSKFLGDWLFVVGGEGFSLRERALKKGWEEIEEYPE